MLKGSKNARIKMPNKKVMKVMENYLTIYDLMEKTKYYEIYKKIYKEEEIYTIKQISIITHYSESSISRIINYLRLLVNVLTILSEEKDKYLIIT